MHPVTLHINLFGEVSLVTIYPSRVSYVSMRCNYEKMVMSVFIFDKRMRPIFKLYLPVLDIMKIVHKQGQSISDVIRILTQNLSLALNNVLGKNSVNSDQFYYWENVHINKDELIRIYNGTSNLLSKPTQQERDKHMKDEIERERIELLGGPSSFLLS